MKKLFLSILLLFVVTVTFAQQEIPLYTHMGSDTTIAVVRDNAGQINVVTGISVPTFTVYLPDPQKATGTAVILCAGGGLRMLAWGTDVLNMSKWLNDRGIAAIGVKYRLNTTRIQRPSNSANPFGQMALNVNITQFSEIEHANANPDKSGAGVAVIDTAIVDVRRALQLVRQNATQWGIDAQKVGYLGFSAGGGAAIGATLMADESTMPNFLATAYGPSLMDVTVPQNAPPLFIATRADHQNVAAGLLSLFLEWKKGGAKAEMYIYDDGRMGFGPDDTGTTSGTWRESFYRWLTSNGF